MSNTMKYFQIYSPSENLRSSCSLTLVSPQLGKMCPTSTATGTKLVPSRDIYRESSRIVPQRYPCGVLGGTEQSTQCDGGSFVAGTATPTCHSGIGRLCCRHGRRFYPVNRHVRTNFVQQHRIPKAPSSWCFQPAILVLKSFPNKYSIAFPSRDIFPISLNHLRPL